MSEKYQYVMHMLEEKNDGPLKKNNIFITIQSFNYISTQFHPPTFLHIAPSSNSNVNKQKII